jgi:hypothetical protein
MSTISPISNGPPIAPSGISYSTNTVITTTTNATNTNIPGSAAKTRKKKNSKNKDWVHLGPFKPGDLVLKRVDDPAWEFRKYEKFPNDLFLKLIVGYTAVPWESNGKEENLLAKYLPIYDLLLCVGKRVRGPDAQILINQSTNTKDPTKSYLDSGYVYAPYVPLVTTPVIGVTQHTNLLPNIILGDNYTGTIEVSPTTVSSTNTTTTTVDNTFANTFTITSDKNILEPTAIEYGQNGYGKYSEDSNFKTVRVYFQKFWNLRTNEFETHQISVSASDKSFSTTPSPGTITTIIYNSNSTSISETSSRIKDGNHFLKKYSGEGYKSLDVIVEEILRDSAVSGNK